MRGRKPTPTALKLLNGNPGKRPLNESEPQPEQAVPDCPEHLSPSARAEWGRLSAELFELGLLTRLDRAALAAYCTAYGRWFDAEAKLKETGPVVKSPAGTPVQNPYLSVANAALEQMRKFLVEFGMTPSSRSRIHVKQESPKSALEAFLKNAS